MFLWRSLSWQYKADGTGVGQNKLKSRHTNMAIDVEKRTLETSKYNKMQKQTKTERWKKTLWKKNKPLFKTIFIKEEQEKLSNSKYSGSLEKKEIIKR